MKNADFRMFLMVFFAGIAVAVWTPQSWYAVATAMPAPAAQVLQAR